jgi:hypothetical protein
MFFAGPLADRYRRLAAVLEHTAKKHLPSWDVRVEEVRPQVYDSAMGNLSHGWNTQKLVWWRDQIVNAPDGARVLLIDGDTAILRPLDPAWEQRFDVAYTVRPRGLPLNGGVMFVRVSNRTRHFMSLWAEHNLRFIGDAVAHEPWRTKYAGINQSALGYVLEREDHGCHIVQLQCREWNACSPDLFSPSISRVLHVKSGFRRAIFEPTATSRKAYKPLIDLWTALETEASRG